MDTVKPRNISCARFWCNKLNKQDKKLIWQVLKRTKPMRERQLSRLKRSIEGAIQSENNLS